MGRITMHAKLYFSGDTFSCAKNQLGPRASHDRTFEKKPRIWCSEGVFQVRT
jgi:hypothetical protein